MDRQSAITMRPVQPGPELKLATGRQKLLGHLAMLLFALLIAGSFSLGDMAAPHIGPAALNAVRFVIATSLLALLSVKLRRNGLVMPQALWRFAILGALMALYFVLMFVALRLSSPVSTGAVFTLMPLMSAGFGWLFLRQVTRPVVFISLIVAAMGAIWVIFRGDLQALLSFDIGTGELLFVVGCAAHAAYAPLVRKFNRGEPVIDFTLFTLVATTLWVVLAGLPQIAQTAWLALPAIVWPVIFYLAIFTTAGTFFLLQFATMRLASSKVLSYGYLTPSFVILIEGALGHGWASPAIFAGSLVTAIALVIMVLAPDG